MENFLCKQLDICHGLTTNPVISQHGPAINAILLGQATVSRKSNAGSVINNLHSKSSYGYDGISTILLKKLEALINKPLTLIINQSLNSGISPEKLKISKISPIYKKNDIHYNRIAFDLDRGNKPLAIYLDLSKAFDTLNHAILIDKLITINLILFQLA